MHSGVQDPIVREKRLPFVPSSPATLRQKKDTDYLTQSHSTHTMDICLSNPDLDEKANTIKNLGNINDSVCPPRASSSEKHKLSHRLNRKSLKGRKASSNKGFSNKDLVDELDPGEVADDKDSDVATTITTATKQESVSKHRTRKESTEVNATKT